jgi:hypothetical protein
MPGTIEQPTADRTPVFVSDGRGRNHAVRVAAATFGLLLAGWLAALAAGLIGFSGLPKLALPGAGAARTAPAAPDPAPAGRHPMGHHTRPGGSSLPPGTPSGARHGTANGATTGGSHEGATAQAGSGQVASTSSSSPKAGGGGAQSQPTTPPGGTPAQASHGNPPSFTPPSSGEKSANAPRGKSADAPGSTVSADPPGKATRPHSG